MNKIVFKFLSVSIFVLSIFRVPSLADVAGYPPSNYYVSITGNDANPGTKVLPFRTVQKAANVVQAGQVVEVLPGEYGEHVVTKVTGTVNSPIAFVAASGGVAAIAGFEIRHNYITVDGFGLDGNNTAIAGYQGVIHVRQGTVGCTVLNNLIHDWKATVYGMVFYESAGVTPSNCLVKNNVFKNAGFHIISLNGSNHRIENNTFDTSKGWDALRVFGNNHIIRKNYFTNINEVAGNGNHVDIIQGFDDIGTPAHDILFEGNFIVNSKTQIGQINNDHYSDLVYNWTFKDNVFARMFTPYNLNASIKGMRLSQNTFAGTGMVALGQISDKSAVVANAFVGNGTGSAGSGWYGAPQGRIYAGQLGKWVNPYYDCGTARDQECINLRNAYINSALLQPLQAAGLLGVPNGNGVYPILPVILSLTSSAQLTLVAPFTNFREVIYQTLLQDYGAKASFDARHNFVAGPAPTYAAKSSSCTELYRPFNFCEPNSVNGVNPLNGGDPQFVNINDPLGPDGIPFTQDDGLRPALGSRLCAGGANNSHIGAYPCSGPLEVAGASSARVPNVVRTAPRAPNQLTVAK